MPDAGKAEEARAKQSKQDKNATLSMLKGKKPATTDFVLYLTDEDGERTEVKLRFKAIGAVEYDKLVAKHPPKSEQRVEGAAFNIDTFAPALISRCSVIPEMSLEDAEEIWNSPEWSRGDLMVLFRNAVDVNNRGLDIPFTENG